MIKIGDRVYFYQNMNRVGTVIDVITKSNNQLTVGGTTEARVYIKVRFDDDEEVIYNRGDIQKYFD